MTEGLIIVIIGLWLALIMRDRVARAAKKVAEHRIAELRQEIEALRLERDNLRGRAPDVLRSP